MAIIDDNLAVLGALGRLLSELGYGTELYASAKEFRDVAMTSDANCLIVDVQLGNSCGIALAQHLSNAGFKIPIVFMSGNSGEAVRRRVLEVGCIDFLAKPFSADALIKTLAKVFPPRLP